MISVLLAGVVIAAIVLVSEYLGRHKYLRGEAARKSVHILGGMFIATWPFFMSFKTIQAVCLVATVAVIAVRYLKLFGSLHNVDRKSAGDILFVLGVLAAALATDNKWIFAAALLHLSLADGLAALIGTRSKRKPLLDYHGERRTLAGSLTFFVTSLLILGWVMLVAPSGLHDSPIYIPWIAILATFIEGVSIWGSDNVLVPLYIAAMLESLR